MDNNNISPAGKPTIKFRKLCLGVYWNDQYNFSIHHEPVWSAQAGRKWVAEWKESYLGLMMPTKRSLKFDTLAEARAFLTSLVDR